MTRIKALITSYHRYQILGIVEVDDVVRSAEDHIDGFYRVPANLKPHYLTSSDIPLLDQTKTMHHDKLLPFAVMPALLIIAFFNNITNNSLC